MTALSTHNITQAAYRIQDESFISSESFKYILSIRISKDALSFCILDSSRNKFIVLESYDFGHQKDFLAAESKIRNLFDQIPLFVLPFKSVNVFIVHPYATLVPAAIFDDKLKMEYLGFNHPAQNQERVFADHIRTLDTWNVFSVPENIVQILSEKFRGIKIHQYSTALLTGVLTQYKNVNEKKLVIHIQANSFDLLLIEGGKLHYFNSFNYTSTEDLMYYLIFSCEQLHLNPEKIELVLLGEIEKKSTIYAYLHKYFRNTVFGKRNDSVQYSYGFDDLPSSYFYNLLNQFLCE